MATIKLFFRPSSRSEREGALYFRIIHRRRVCQIHTGIKVASTYLDQREQGKIPPGDDTECRLLRIRSRIESVVRTLDSSGMGYSARDVVDKYLEVDAVTGLISFGRKLMGEYESMGKENAADHTRTVINSFMRFYGKEDVPFGEFDSTLVCRYESYLKAEGLCPNTTSYYMRRLRAIYNMAVAGGYTPHGNPFRTVYTGVAKTVKRAVSIDSVRQLRALDLSRCPLDAMARDMFLFSFYTRGMAPVDMAYLRKKDLHDGILTYRRRKTSQQLTIKWEEPMAAIADRYKNDESPYILPMIKPCGKDERRQYLSASHLINRHLKDIGRRIGLTEPLTLYVARHSWASIAHDNDIPVSVISQGMGHESEATTRIYLASLDRARLDKANNDIISLLDH